jgi:putative ABC transport system ATP-binding protein
MLRLEKITVSFNGRHVLKGLSCRVDKGDFVVVMGPNGTGKSTLFDIISGKTMAHSGSVFLDEEDVTRVSEQKRAHVVGRLFQNTYLGSCSILTVRENLGLAALKGKRAALNVGVKALTDTIIEERLVPLQLNLEKLLDVPMGALSGGQRQIISFVMTTLKPPSILLLDEPTAALDPLSATKLLAFAHSYAKSHAIPTLLITHDPMVARHLGNRLWIVENGIIEREFGAEKRDMFPQEFFHHIDYEKLADQVNASNSSLRSFSEMNGARHQ